MDAQNVTPMMQQYLSAKAAHPNELLFFRLGDFYEMFFDDAKVAAKELGLTLTSRSGDLDKSPMCGVPYHAADSYIARLVAKGFKVAIAEQIGDPKAKGLTHREVVKVVTPGTALSDEVLRDAANIYIALLHESTDGTFVLAGADISTGETFYALYRGETAAQQILDELYRRMTAELLMTDGFSLADTVRAFRAQRLPHCAVTMIPTAAKDELLSQHFPAAEIPTDAGARTAVAALLGYLHDTVMADLSQINRLAFLDTRETMQLDTYTLRNLEITRSLRDGGKKNTLFDVLDFTRTPMGTRLLKAWLEHPLLVPHRIDARLDAVAELAEKAMLRGALREHLRSVYDFERLLTRIETQTANARDLVALRVSLAALPAVREALDTAVSGLLMRVHASLQTFDELRDTLARAIVDEPGLSVREGGIIRAGYDGALDELRAFSHDSKSLLQEMEERERARTGIKTLKIGYNKVFGYYIEVRHSGRDQVPADYIRKQTLANTERFITEELKDFEAKILGAEEKITALEYHIFTQLRERVKAELVPIQNVARRIARVDVLQSLAEAAASYRYVRPAVTADGAIRIRDGRHPLVERILDREIFVPNDTDLSHGGTETMLITGPNMAGKSTYMRQVALLTLMAQVGSFVPARTAEIAPVDRIFTRIGASDDLVSGQSTFMVEMNEVAQILREATRDSLVILDEIGRGTSTFDGMSIARAVVEHIDKHIHAKTLFATHYHELTEMENARIRNYCIAVREKGKNVAFLRRIVAGAADKSYGIHVARLAGLPPKVTARAEEILHALEQKAAESGAGDTAAAQQKAAPVQSPADGMTSLFADGTLAELRTLDIMTMTPLEAMNTLYRLQEQARKEAGEA
ncbi:DNA mismatch repair protein MutS [Selenomonas sp. oral taxon 920]|uniref:DNA mismatch repair protein MutS n=1 Tax=Selenomonas sp. oral taxon 920 TaxID=1884263 RepID=UPI000840DA62|nr:DNA mismatch repair protein MutS [Selenomonas sp. oral taxon 920]AOH48524.1 DNA mismatch repair protein MutS [Selenomonas sp. oral taxon 920]